MCVCVCAWKPTGLCTYSYSPLKRPKNVNNDTAQNIHTCRYWGEGIELARSLPHQQCIKLLLSIPIYHRNNIDLRSNKTNEVMSMQTHTQRQCTCLHHITLYVHVILCRHDTACSGASWLIMDSSPVLCTCSQHVRRVITSPSIFLLHWYILHRCTSIDQK